MYYITDYRICQGGNENYTAAAFALRFHYDGIHAANLDLLNW